MKWFILIMGILLIGCIDENSKKQKYASDLYDRITDQIYNKSSNLFNSSWQKIEENIIANKKILYMMSNDEFSIVVIRNNFDMNADTTAKADPDTSAIMSSPAMDKIEDAIKNLETLAKKMQGEK